MRTPFFSPRVVGVCALLTLSGCSESAPPADDATPEAVQPARAATASSDGALPHPCTLLTGADAEEVLGPGANTTRNSDSSCLLRSATGSSEIGVKIEPLDLDVWDGGNTMIAMDSEARKVPDIGDGGYTFGGGNIVFAEGPAEVKIIMSLYVGSSPAFDVARVVARKVAAGLQ